MSMAPNYNSEQIDQRGIGKFHGTAFIAIVAAVSSLIGAGTSFAPLYIGIWGGDMYHANCPVLGSRPVPDSEYGLCVTSPRWFGAVTLVCLCLAVLGAVAFVHTANRIVSLRLDEGAARRGAKPAGYYIDPVNIGCLAATVMAVLVLVIVSGNWGVVPFVVVWWLVSFFAMRLLRAGKPHTGSRVLFCVIGAGLFGMVPAVFTQWVLMDRVSASGGVQGAMLGACAAYALLSAGLFAGMDEVRVNGAGADPPHRIRIPRGAIAQLIVMVFALVSYRGYANPQEIGALCPALSATSIGGLVSSCLSESMIHMIIVTENYAVAFSLVTGLVALLAQFVAMRRPATKRGALRFCAMLSMTVSSALAGALFIIWFTFA